VLSYFEAIHWRAVDAGTLQPSCSATAVFRRRGYWAAKNTRQETSRDRFTDLNLGQSIADIECELAALGFGEGLLCRHPQESRSRPRRCARAAP
jgi:hypothetical protein